MEESERRAHDADLASARDRAFMDLALAEARAAAAADEVPVGAVIVIGDRVVARAHNATRRETDPTRHAELCAISIAARECGESRLVDAEVFTTLEPCFMCAGALLHARVRRVVWSVRDPKFGGCVSLGRVLDDPRANHHVVTSEGVGADESRALLRSFFQKKRGSSKSS